MSVHAAMTSMLVARAVSLGVMTVGIAVLGRLLDPTAFGQFAVLVTIHSAARTLAEFGLPAYLIRGREVTGAMLSGAAGLSLAIAAALCLAGLGAALLLPAGLLPPAMALALVPLSLALLPGPFAMGAEVRLQRDIDFALIARIGVLRVLADVAVAIVLAAQGFGVTALAWGLFAGHASAAGAMLLWAGRARQARPRLGGWRGFRGFGGRMTVTQLLPDTTEIAVTALVTATLGAATMGLLNRAQTIQKMVDRTLFEGILPVILPAMSAALARGEAPLAIWRRQIDYLAAICWPGFACIAVLADPLVRLLLGPDWEAAVPGVRILALAGLGVPLTKMSQKFFVAAGLVDEFLRVTIVLQAVRLGLVLAAVQVSFAAVCLAVTAGVWWKAGHLLAVVRRRFGPSRSDLAGPVLRGAALTAASVAGPLLTLRAGLPAPATLLLGVPLALAGWGAALLLLRHPLAGELRLALHGLRRARGG